MCNTTAFDVMGRAGPVAAGNREVFFTEFILACSLRLTVQEMFFVLVVTIEGGLMGNWINWTLTTFNYNLLYPYRQVKLCTSLQQALSFSVCCLVTTPLVTASNGGRYPSSGFSNCPHTLATAIIYSQ
jgi:hypothetical protein